MKNSVLLFANGNAAVCIDGQQMPALQTPWIVTFAAWLQSQDHDPTTFEWNLPNGRAARLFRTETSWNWMFEEDLPKG